MRCDICPAFAPNRSSADLQRASAVWAELFDVHIAATEICCSGCRGSGEGLLDKECPVRSCVLSRGLEDCAQCPQMPCENLKKRWVSREELELKHAHPIPEDDYQKYVLPFENAPYLKSFTKRG